MGMCVVFLLLVGREWFRDVAWTQSTAGTARSAFLHIGHVRVYVVVREVLRRRRG